MPTTSAGAAVTIQGVGPSVASALAVVLGVACLVFSLIHVVPGDPGNFKITTREDLERAELVLARRALESHAALRTPEDRA